MAGADGAGNRRTSGVTPCLLADASPFIALAKTGHDALLRVFERPVQIVQTVAGEVNAAPPADLARQALAVALADGWLSVVADVPAPAALSAFRLDAGERATLALALTLTDALVVADDRAARRAAEMLATAGESLTLTGTIGVVVTARQKGQIPAAAPLLLALQAVGLFLPSDADVGETWP